MRQPELLAPATEPDSAAPLGRLALAYAEDADQLTHVAVTAVAIALVELDEPADAPLPPAPVQRTPYPARFLVDKAWGTGHLKYAEQTAIRMAIDIVGLGPDNKAHDRYIGSSDQLCIAARNLGASGATRAELLADLTGILSLYGVRPIPTVRQALESLWIVVDAGFFYSQIPLTALN